MAQPAAYSVLVEECNGFLLQCSLVFEMQPLRYPTDSSKIAFVISLLTVKVLHWAETLWTQKGAVTQSVKLFTEHFRAIFGHSAKEASAGEQLYYLKQGTMTVQEYSLKFHTSQPVG